MTEHEKSRLERVEQFIDRLKMGSYIAKAAGEGGRIVGNRNALEPEEQDLARSATDSGNPVAALQRRVKQLETLVRTLMAAPTGRPVVTPTAQGEGVLAKAVAGFHDADSLLSYADSLTDDPTVMGVISGHLAAGDMRAAKSAVLELAERKTVVKAPDVMAQVVGAGGDADLATYDSRAAVSELAARFGKLEQLLSSVEARLAQIERRPQAAPVDAGEIVAKASGSKRKLTKSETEARLMAQIDAYIDSPSVVGQLSSMVSAGQYAEVRKMLTGAKRAHEAAKISAERKRF